MIVLDFLFNALVTIAIVDRRYYGACKSSGTVYCINRELNRLWLFKRWHFELLINDKTKLLLSAAFEIYPCWVELFTQDSQFVFSDKFSSFHLRSDLQIPTCVGFCLFHCLISIQRSENHLPGFIRF